MKRVLKAIVFFMIISCCPLISVSQVTTQQPIVKVEGEVTIPLNLSLADIAAMKHVEVSMKDRDGKNYNYSGVPISDILARAGATMGKDLRGENLVKYLVAKAQDGYEVIFSLAELDPDFTDRLVILADQLNGKPIPDGKGPFRIIVQGEKKPARCVFEVTNLIVKFAN